MTDIDFELTEEQKEIIEFAQELLKSFEFYNKMIDGYKTYEGWKDPIYAQKIRDNFASQAQAFREAMDYKIAQIKNKINDQ